MITQNSGATQGIATMSGITRSGANKYPNPFFDIASEYVPSDINSIFELAEFLMTTMAPFQAVTRRVVRYFLTEIVVEGEDDDERGKYEDLFKQLKLLDVLGEIGEDYACFHGDTRVITRDGVFPIRELAGKTVDVLSQGGVWRPAAFRSYGRQQLMRITLSDGTEVLATPEHQWIVRSGSGRLIRTTTDRLCLGHCIPRVTAPRPELDSDYLTGVCHGFVYGDGTLYNRRKKTTFAAANFFDGKIEDMLPYFERYGAAKPCDASRDTYYGHSRCKRIHGLPASWKSLPDNKASTSYWYGFVCGLFAADGHVDTYGCPVLVQNNKDAIMRIMEQLPRIGMAPGKVCEAEYSSTFRNPDGSPYSVRGTSYRLGILKNTCSSCDFLLQHHRKAFDEKLNPKSKYGKCIGIKSIESTDLVDEVYCCNEPETHTFVIANGLLTGNCYGNALISLYLPFDRILLCPDCATAYHCEAIDYAFKDGEFTGVCPKCNRTVTFGHRDQRSPDTTRARIIRWNPKRIKLRVHPVSGRTEHYLELDQEFCQKIREGNKFFLNDTPWAMVQTALRPKDNLFLFREGSLFHLKAGSLAGLPIRGWGIPPMLPNFKLAYYIQLLRRYDEAITLDYIVPFRVLFPQAAQSTGQDALSMMNMGMFVAQMTHMVENHRQQMTDVQIAPFAIGYQMLGGEAKQLSPKDNITQAYDELFTAMGYPVELYKGSLSLQAAPVALRLFEKENSHIVTGFDGIIGWVCDLAGRYFHLDDKVDAHLRPVTLADDIERRALTLQAAAGSDISKQTAYRGFGLDFMEEQKRVVEEQKEIQKLQQQAMEESAAQQLDGSGGENAGPNAVVGATPGDVHAQAQELAKSLLTQVPATQRRAELIRVKHSNPTLHALVLQEMDNLRQQAASQGRAMLESGQLG